MRPHDRPDERERSVQPEQTEDTWSTTVWTHPPFPRIAYDYATSDKKRRRKPKAPLVDSTLLRFLSSQRKEDPVRAAADNTTRQTPIRYRQSSTSDDAAAGIEVDSKLSTPIRYRRSSGGERLAIEAEYPSIVSTSINSVQGPPELAEPMSRQTEINGKAYDEGQVSWLSQYNAQRVALRLQELGVDNETSIRAGRVVQDYVLARITRRRIRKFLQEREAMWTAGEYESVSGRNGMTPVLSPEAAKNFDVDAVIAVMTEFGLTGNDVAAIFSHTPSVAIMRARRTPEERLLQDLCDDSGDEPKSFSVEQALDRAFVGLLGETLKLRRYDARKMLRECPGLLTSKGSVSAGKVVDLMISLGSSTNSIARDKKSLSTLLSRSPALIFRLVAFLSSARLRVPLEAIGPILRQKQSAALLDAVAPLKRATTLENMELALQNSTLGSDADILGYLRVHNSVRKDLIEKNYRSMGAVVEVLRNIVGVRDFQKILTSHPNVFFLNATNIRNTAVYLRAEVGMSREDLGLAVQTFPKLLDYDFMKIKHVVDFLLSIEVDAEELPSILRSFPATLFLDVNEDIMPVVDFLRGIGVRNIGRFITRLPPVLGYSVERDLKPKWSFLREVCQFDHFEVVRFPAYFSYPLERVTKMRYEYLRDCKQIPIQLARVDAVLRYGDRDFATEIALDEDGGDAFLEYVKERSGGHKTRRRRVRNNKNRGIGAPSKRVHNSNSVR